jgi:GT2 family glycosyltransferase
VDEAQPVRYSFVIPTTGQPDRLHATIGALARLKYSDASEVIVVLDGRRSPSFTNSLGALATGLRLKVIDQERGGPGRARNLGASHARGDWVVFLDDDCHLNPDFLHVLATAMPAHEALVAVGGCSHTPKSANAWMVASHLVVEAFTASQRDSFGAFKFLPSRNLILRRAAWEKTEGFDEDLFTSAGEDRAFCLRWTGNGGGLLQLEQLSYLHDHPLDLKAFLAKHAQYGEASVLVARKYGLVPGRRYWRFLIDVVRRIEAIRPGSSIPAVVCAIALSQLATAAGWLRARFRRSTIRKSSPPAHRVAKRVS